MVLKHVKDRIITVKWLPSIPCERTGCADQLEAQKLSAEEISYGSKLGPESVWDPFSVPQ